MYQLNTKGINKELFHLEQQGLSFDPASVQKFEWRTRDKISSLEKDSSGQWIPVDRTQKIQDILQQLASLKLTDLEQKNMGQIRVNLEIGGAVWEGQWDGLTFLWTQGPLKGKGSVLNEPLNKFFFRGKFVFDPDPQIQICPEANPLKQVRVTLQSKEFLITQNQSGEWGLKTSKGIQTLAAEFMNSWLKKSCAIRATATLDPAYSPAVDRVVNRLTFFYADKTQLDFFKLVKDLVMTQDRALILAGFEALFDELKAEIQKTQP